jgi:hypothetical protein
MTSKFLYNLTSVISIVVLVAFVVAGVMLFDKLGDRQAQVEQKSKEISEQTANLEKRNIDLDLRLGKIEKITDEDLRSQVEKLKSAQLRIQAYETLIYSIVEKPASGGMPAQQDSRLDHATLKLEAGATIVGVSLQFDGGNIVQGPSELPTVDISIYNNQLVVHPHDLPDSVDPRPKKGYSRKIVIRCFYVIPNKR